MFADQTTAATRDVESSVNSRAALARFMRGICIDISADRYILVQPSVERGPKSVRIITSNWIFDALEDFGAEGIANIIESGNTAGAGERPHALVPDDSAFLSDRERQALTEHGHAEMYCQKLSACGTVAFVLFSSQTRHEIQPAALTLAHMKCCYGLAQFFKSNDNFAANDPLSERERECLVWVSEGKTTDEVALILGVSSNTINSYIANAIQKFGANNRAMAIATAIRSGII
jgi:DNA-binding CsgD family transcriptional regulator